MRHDAACLAWISCSPDPTMTVHGREWVFCSRLQDVPAGIKTLQTATAMETVVQRLDDCQGCVEYHQKASGRTTLRSSMLPESGAASRTDTLSLRSKADSFGLAPCSSAAANRPCCKPQFRIVTDSLSTDDAPGSLHPLPAAGPTAADHGPLDAPEHRTMGPCPGCRDHERQDNCPARIWPGRSITRHCLVKQFTELLLLAIMPA